jgi:hypothetical protein
MSASGGRQQRSAAAGSSGNGGGSAAVVLPKSLRDFIQSAYASCANAVELNAVQLELELRLKPVLRADGGSASRFFARNWGALAPPPREVLAARIRPRVAGVLRKRTQGGAYQYLVQLVAADTAEEQEAWLLPECIGIEKIEAFERAEARKRMEAAARGTESSAARRAAATLTLPAGKANAALAPVEHAIQKNKRSTSNARAPGESVKKRRHEGQITAEQHLLHTTTNKQTSMSYTVEQIQAAMSAPVEMVSGPRQAKLNATTRRNATKSRKARLPAAQTAAPPLLPPCSSSLSSALPPGAAAKDYSPPPLFLAAQQGKTRSVQALLGARAISPSP